MHEYKVENICIGSNFNMCPMYIYLRVLFKRYIFNIYFSVTPSDNCFSNLDLKNNCPKVSQKFFNILVYASLQCVYHMTKAVQDIVRVPSVVGSMTLCALLQTMCNLKAVQMNVQCSLI